LGETVRDDMVASLYAQSSTIVDRAVKGRGSQNWDFDQRIDRIVTSQIFGLPIMVVILSCIFYLTILGANVPSAMLANVLFAFEEIAAGWFDALGAPWWLTGFIWHGVYRGLAWVISVMLPPMAIFFPVFTILEDLG
jgi:ferrous iron transport protein B